MSFKIVIAFVIANGPFVSHINAPTYPRYFDTIVECQHVLDDADFKTDIQLLGDAVRKRTQADVIVTTNCVDAGNEPSAPQATPPPKVETTPAPLHDFRG